MKSLWTVGYMPMQLHLYLVLALLFFMGGNYFLKKTFGKGIPKFGQAVLLWLTVYGFFKFVLFPPIPASLLYTYMGLITMVLFLFVSTSEDEWEEFKRPITSTLGGTTSGYRKARTMTFVALPLLFGFGTYDFLLPKFEEPIELRTVHPAPPQKLKTKGQTITLQTVENPFRIDDNGDYLAVGSEDKYFGTNPFAEDAPKFMQHVREGGEIFFQNCHFCHGDNLDGRGMFAFAFNPIPANFADPGTIAQLQEAYVLWRVAKGGPGLPDQSFPWASVMPPWEQHLSMDEIWKVIMFEYWHTGFFPRTWE